MQADQGAQSMGGFAELSRRELQTLAKKHGIKANGPTATIVQELQAYLNDCAGDLARVLRLPALGKGHALEDDYQDDDEASDQAPSATSRGAPPNPSPQPAPASTHHQDLSSSLAALKLRSRVFGTAVTAHTPTPPAVDTQQTNAAAAPVAMAAARAPAPATTPEAAKVVAPLSLNLTKIKAATAAAAAGVGAVLTGRRAGLTARGGSRGATGGTAAASSQAPTPTAAAAAAEQQAKAAKWGGAAPVQAHQTPTPREEPPTETGPGVLLGQDQPMQQLRDLVADALAAARCQPASTQPASGTPKGKPRLSPLPASVPGASYVGVTLSGPAGNGKGMMARTLAAHLSARFVQLDLPSVLSKAEPDKVGEAVKQACQSVIESVTRHSSVVLLVRDLGLLSRHQDPSKTRACFRAKAELLLGLGQIRSATTNQAPRKSGGSSTVVVIGTVQQQHSHSGSSSGGGSSGSSSGGQAGRQQQPALDVDGAVLAGILGTTGTSQAVETVHVPQASTECREAILYHLLCEAEAELNCTDMDTICRASEGRSSAWTVKLCRLAAAAAAEARTAIAPPHMHAALTALGTQVA